MSYASDGTLYSHIFDAGKDCLCKTRNNIALGTAIRLVYLHEKCRNCIIHCDNKPKNILLDAYMCQEFADMCWVKQVCCDFGKVFITVMGTRRHLSPECYQ